MKRKFKVSVTYDVEIEDESADAGESSVTGLHLMDAVYEYQAGNVRGWTSVFPPARYVTEEETMSWEEVK